MPARPGRTDPAGSGRIRRGTAAEEAGRGGGDLRLGTGGGWTCPEAGRTCPVRGEGIFRVSAGIIREFRGEGHIYR